MKTIHDMDYWELRKIAASLIPRQTLLTMESGDQYKLKQKGRKSNYHQYDLSTGIMEKLERLLSQEGLNSFVEVSLRAQSCPMPLNLDTWDGLKCIVEGQFVATPQGPRKIEDLTIGDEVLAVNTDSPERSEVDCVTALSTSLRSDILEIRCGGKSLRTTRDHLFFTQRGWIEAQLLEPSDCLLIREGV